MILAILAAGGSRRFGSEDKLVADLGGKMVGLHAAEAFVAVPFDEKIVVTVEDHPCSADWKGLDYHLLFNDRATDGQATSVAMAAQYAKNAGIGALCICLADMPFVTAAHVSQLCDEFQQLNGQQIMASSCSEKALPPVIFPASFFSRLASLQGDQGARKLLSSARTVHVNEPMLMDIDSSDDLQSARGLLA